jgi:hypothetical protein
MPFEPKVCCGSRGPKHRGSCQSEEAVAAREDFKAKIASNKTARPDEDVLLKRIAELERRDEENQKKLEVLYAVADKGRLFNHESGSKEKKPVKVKLSVYDDKYVVGWRTVKDELIHDPRTGRTVGEAQQYDLLLLGRDGLTTTQSVSGYLNFSNARYNERVECEVLSRQESQDGRLTFNVSLPDGRMLELDSKFIN